MTSKTISFAAIVVFVCLPLCSAFNLEHGLKARCKQGKLYCQPLPSSSPDDIVPSPPQPRRRYMIAAIPSILTLAVNFPGSGRGSAFAADVSVEGSLKPLLGQITEARDQLGAIPDLIKAEKWDSVRAILVKPPLSDLWTSGGSKKLLMKYADAISELPDGDEIAALELREDVISHLRYLDMAVYNNIFNPVGTEGETGATKELVRSYREDPTMEWKASKAALDGLVGLGTK